MAGVDRLPPSSLLECLGLAMSAMTVVRLVMDPMNQTVSLASLATSNYLTLARADSVNQVVLTFLVKCRFKVMPVRTLCFKFKLLWWSELRKASLSWFSISLSLFTSQVSSLYNKT